MYRQSTNLNSEFSHCRECLENGIRDSVCEKFTKMVIWRLYKEEMFAVIVVCTKSFKKPVNKENEKKIHDHQEQCSHRIAYMPSLILIYRSTGPSR